MWYNTTIGKCVKLENNATSCIKDDSVVQRKDTEKTKKKKSLVRKKNINFYYQQL